MWRILGRVAVVSSALMRTRIGSGGCGAADLGPDALAAGLGQMTMAATGAGLPDWGSSSSSATHLAAIALARWRSLSFAGAKRVFTASGAASKALMSAAMS